MEYPIKRTAEGLALLNLGCGNHYHLDWNNVDFGKRGTEVIGYNLLNGIPFPTGSFDVVYHSHVLEHFDRVPGKQFMQECYRVLKPGGTIRVVVPDLEQIVRFYLNNLEAGVAGDPVAVKKHEWSLLELFDQVARTSKGGQMAKGADQADPLMRDYIISRHGYEMRERWEKNPATQRTTLKNDPDLGRFLGKMHKRFLTRLLGLFGGQSMAEAFKAGLFKQSGELHLQMYDQLLLGNLLRELGLDQVHVTDAFTSNFKNFAAYQLDTIHSEIRKPDSLFMEGIKPL